MHDYVLGSLILKENSSGRNGLMADLSVECSSCLEAKPLKTSDTITKKGQSFDVNRRAVYHSLETEGGYEGLVTFCSIMNMPYSIPAGEHTHKASEERDKRRLRKSDLQTSVKEKKRRQGEQMRHTHREDALQEADGDTYEPGGF